MGKGEGNGVPGVETETLSRNFILVRHIMDFVTLETTMKGPSNILVWMQKTPFPLHKIIRVVTYLG